MSDSLTILGRVERIDFPEWDLYDIDAKIDSGAYTSSLHCHHITSHVKKSNKYVRFNLFDPSHKTYNKKVFELPVFKTKSVKSSNGTTEERIIVKTRIHIGDQALDAEFSLTDRSEMRYPVLIGRKLIKGYFLVNVSRKYLAKKSL